MTLIEIMVVVGILALLMVVLIFYMMPSDDRRCKLEAERLAAYMTAASAEAVMSDGAIRVAFDFKGQHCDRQQQRLRAAVTDKQWEDDETARQHKVGKPVRLSELDVRSGLVTQGVGWIGFRGKATSGGVAVLTLNKAVWSVIVAPHGDIRIERGRAKLPERPMTPLFRPGGLPLDPLMLGAPGSQPSTGGSAPTVVSGGGSARGNSPSRSVGSNNDEPDEDDTPPEDDPQPDAGLQLDAGTPNLDAGIEEDAEVDASTDECQVDEDCTAAWSICEDRKCVVDASNRSFSLKTMQITEPNQIAPFFTTYLQRELDARRLSLGFKIDQGNPSSNGSGRSYPAWIVNTKRAGGGTYRLDTALPSYRYIATQEDNCSGGSICLKLEPQGSPKMRLFLPRSAGPVDGCAYTQIGVVANLRLAIDTSTGQADVTFSGVIGRNDAEDVLFTPSQLRSMGISGSWSANSTVGLDEVFAFYEIDEDALDSEGSIASANAWKFQFVGKTNPSQILGSPESQLGRNPDGCEN